MMSPRVSTPATKLWSMAGSSFSSCRINERRVAAKRIAAASLRQRFLVVLMALVLIGAGWWAFERLPMDAYPDLSPPMVEIITQWPGHAAEEVERLITVPVELGMNGIPQTATKRSISLYGLSDVILTFQNNTDNY